MKKAIHFVEYFKRDLPFIGTRLMNVYVLRPWVRRLNIQTPDRIEGKSPKVNFTKCFPCNIFVFPFIFPIAYQAKTRALSGKKRNADYVNYANSRSKLNAFSS